MDRKTSRDLLFFGYGLSLIAAFFGFRDLAQRGDGVSWTLLACALLFASVTAWKRQALLPGYGMWMKAAHLIGGVVTALILGAVFFCVFAPIGILLRLLRKDHLQRRLDPGAATYWCRRPAPARDQQSYTRQF